LSTTSGARGDGAVVVPPVALAAADDNRDDQVSRPSLHRNDIMPLRFTDENRACCFVFHTRPDFGFPSGIAPGSTGAGVDVGGSGSTAGADLATFFPAPVDFFAATIFDDLTEK
jgi:hypothetical protein